ncbi:hypothetical protein KEM56_002095 [Ascosphaera pollenicola]|nr:hypothetical protein KEM56_002095 [Ascosphaera pollenicola]
MTTPLTVELCEKPEQIILLIGPPGVGKGTLGRLFASETEFYHFSVGDYLREQAAICDFLSVNPQEDTDRNVIGLNIDDRKRIRASQLLDSEILMPLMKRHMNKIMKKDDGTKKFLIDGFPRSLEQAEAFATFARPDLVINLLCPEPVVRTRYLQRNLQNRAPDTEEKFVERYQEYLRNRQAIEGCFVIQRIPMIH